MKTKVSILLFFVILSVIFSCCKEDPVSPKPSPIDITEEIVGEWVYENPIEATWQSMKFSETGKFYYSEDKNDWSTTLQRTDGNYWLDGMDVSGSMRSTNFHIDMTIQEISDYSFTTRYKNTGIDFTFFKVLMRTHLNFEESTIPPYSELINTEIISYKSHDNKIATVDPITGEITAIAKDGRTYIDLTTKDGTACIKVMIGRVNDGDESEICTIPNKKEPIQIDNLDVSKIIVGPLWVYDHPEENVWEVIRFLDSGTVYFSNKNGDWDFENQDANGTYEIDQKTISGNVKLNAIYSMDFYWVVTKITNMEFTVKTYSSGEYGGRFTYAKQLDKLELHKGESISPNYQQLVGDLRINGFKSHNTSCLSVDNETGEIKALRVGHTYVDIITEEGTAVIEVSVNSFMQYNYEDFIGVNKQTVTNTFESFYTTDGDDMIYNYSKGSVAEAAGAVKDTYWDFITFKFNSTTGLVKAIVLLAKKDVWFTPDEMTQYLSQRFYVYEKGTEEDYKAFINAENLEDATVGITWDTTNGILTYVEIIHEKETSVLDYGGYLGKTREEIKSMMSGYSLLSETDERIGYMISSDYIRMARFSFKVGDVIKETIQEVDLYLNTDIDQNFVKSEIEKNYVYSDGVEGNFLNYYSEDKTIRVVYQIGSNRIQFIQQ